MEAENLDQLLSRPRRPLELKLPILAMEMEEISLIALHGRLSQELLTFISHMEVSSSGLLSWFMAQLRGGVVLVPQWCEVRI